MDVRSKRGADFGSNHHLVLETIRIKIARTQKSISIRKKKFDIDQLQEAETSNRFNLNATNRFEYLEQSEEETVD